MQGTPASGTTTTPREASAFGQSEEIFRRSLWNLMSNLTASKPEPGGPTLGSRANGGDVPRQHQDN